MRYILLALSFLFVGQEAQAARVRPENLPFEIGSASKEPREKAICANGVEGSKLAINACSKLLATSKLNNNEKATFLHFRSVHKEAAADLKGALSDIDEAAKYDAQSWQIEAQRCWLRAALNIDLENAAKQCARALEIGGPNYRVIDSLSLIQFRQGSYTKAYSGYTMADAYKTWDHAVFGQKLSLIAGIAKADHDPAFQSRLELMKKYLGEVGETLAKLAPEHVAEAESIYARMGLTVESAQALGAKATK